MPKPQQSHDSDSQAKALSNSKSSKKTATENTPIKIAIIGGGLSGLFTATLLQRAFSQSDKHTNLPQITIFEKSRSVGRLATRYRTADKSLDNKQNWQWSFGAQFFTAKSEAFSQFIAPWLNSAVLQPWCAQVVTLTPADSEGQSDIVEKEQWDTEHARYISTPKMTSWGRALADDLPETTIKFKTRVAPLAAYSQLQSAKKTELFDEQGESLGVFDWVICTAPNAQAVELMADSGFTHQAKILQPKMLACYTLMLGWDADQALPETLSQESKPTWDVAYMQDSILDRIFIEHNKPNHDQLLPSVTIHANNEWSEQHVDEDIDSIKAQLLGAAKQALHWNEQTAPTQVDCHRWRYASTLIPLDSEGNEQPLGILVDKQHQWIVGGDWCGQGNIESCYQMAEETVAIIAHEL